MGVCVALTFSVLVAGAVRAQESIGYLVPPTFQEVTDPRALLLPDLDELVGDGVFVTGTSLGDVCRPAYGRPRRAEWYEPAIVDAFTDPEWRKRFVIGWDPGGRRSLVEVWDQGELQSRVRIVRSADGRVRSILNGDGRVAQSFTYSGEGRLQEVSYLDGAPEELVARCEYDGGGRLVAVRRTRGAHLVGESLATYNKSGLVQGVETRALGALTESSRFDYGTYDDETGGPLLRLVTVDRFAGSPDRPRHSTILAFDDGGRMRYRLRPAVGLAPLILDEYQYPDSRASSPVVVEQYRVSGPASTSALDLAGVLAHCRSESSRYERDITVLSDGYAVRRLSARSEGQSVNIVHEMGCRYAVDYSGNWVRREVFGAGASRSAAAAVARRDITYWE